MSADILPHQLGRYEIRERIGVGGMARVYQGWDTNLDRIVAVKILHEHLAEDTTFKERFAREAKFIASLNHPNIVQVYDFDTVDKADGCISYMVMPYIPGKTLKTILEESAEKGERLSHERVRTIMIDLCAALDYAHARGMVHRDVKPANILFDEHDRAVLTDFGIARLAEAAELTQEGMSIGTPTYFSPEQAAGLPVDPRSDLYALGIILYEMLAGKPPFTADSNLSLILKHLNEPAPSIRDALPDAEPALETLLNKSLAKNPDDRHPTAKALADDIARVFGGESIPAAPPTHNFSTANSAATETITSSTPPQRPMMPFAIIGIVALIVLGAAVLLTSNNAPPASEPITPVSSMTSDEGLYFISSFSPDDPSNARWPQGDMASVAREITADGFYRFESELVSAAITSLYDPTLTYTNSIITLEGFLEADSPPASGYGIVFGYVDERNYYVFAVDGVGRYSIWELKEASWRELRGQDDNWTEDAAVNPVGEPNRLSVTILGDHVTGMVNDQVLADITLDQPPGGGVGIYLATTRSGGATALIDTYQVSGDIPSMTGS